MWNTTRQTLDHSQIPDFARIHWNAESLTLVNEGYNIVYHFPGGYLRICHPVLRSVEDTERVIHFLAHLVQHGTPACAPVRSNSGNYIETLPGGFYGAVVQEVPGEEIGLHHKDAAVYEAWGRSLAQLHRASEQYKAPFPTIQQFWENVRPASTEIQAAFNAIDAWLPTLPLEQYGICHGDYRPGNVIWDGTTAYTVDFDEPVYNWFISDVARALLEFSDHPLRRQFRDSFIKGYRAVRPLEDFWVDQLSRFMQMRGLLMHLWTIQEGNKDNWALKWALNRVEW